MDDTTGRVDTDRIPASSQPRTDVDRDRVSGRADEAARGYAIDDGEPDDRRTRQIREEIEDTRGEMAETIEAIQEKLKPRNLMADASERVKSATSERVREMTQTASRTTQQAMDYTRDTASSVADRMRQHPIPLALIAIGAGWLLSSQGRSRKADRHGREYDRDDQRFTSGAVTGASGAAQTTSRAMEYASDSARSMRHMAQRRQTQVERMVRQNPLLVGAGALLLGAAFGLAVPETEVENEWMGEARDNVVDRARGMARDAATEVQDAVGSVTEAARKLTGA